MSSTVINPDLVEVGNRIRQIRKEKRMTQQELADQIGIADKHLSRLEMGVTNMKLDTFFTVAAALGVSPNDISPKRFTPEQPQSALAGLEGKYNQLNESQKQIVCATMNALLTSLTQLHTQ